MINKVILIGATSLASTAYAQGTYNLKYGVGIMKSTESQVVSVAYQDQIKDSYSYQVECGAWLDPKENKGRSGSGFCATQAGLRILLSNFYAESMHGIGFITHPDALLGGRFQFFHDAGLGIKDVAGNAIGINFKHVSSAGIHKPNIGRNYLAAKLSFGF